MEINISEPVKQVISIFVLMILPLIVIGLGLVFEILNAWYFVLAVTWFGTGLIFYCAIE